MRLTCSAAVVPRVQQEEGGALELYSVYVPTNHIYVGDIFLLGKEDVINTNLSVREGLGAGHPCLMCSCCERWGMEWGRLSFGLQEKHI